MAVPFLRPCNCHFSAILAVPFLRPCNWIFFAILGVPVYRLCNCFRHSGCALLWPCNAFALWAVPLPGHVSVLDCHYGFIVVLLT